MPRIARIVAPGYPHHVTQRANNRATVFFDDQARQTYLELLAKYSKLFALQIWAYCLIDNHIHLLVVPENEKPLARGVGLTNQVYTQYLNRKRNQSGRIWQNRFFSCLVENNNCLWTVARYIECNPIKAELVENVEDYRWPSAKARLTTASDELLHKPYWLEERDKADIAVENVMGRVKAANKFKNVAERIGDALRKKVIPGPGFGDFAGYGLAGAEVATNMFAIMGLKDCRRYLSMEEHAYPNHFSNVDWKKYGECPTDCEEYYKKWANEKLRE